MKRGPPPHNCAREAWVHLHASPCVLCDLGWSLNLSELMTLGQLASVWWEGGCSDLLTGQEVGGHHICGAGGCVSGSPLPHAFVSSLANHIHAAILFRVTLAGGGLRVGKACLWGRDLVWRLCLQEDILVQSPVTGGVGGGGWEGGEVEGSAGGHSGDPRPSLPLAHSQCAPTSPTAPQQCRPFPHEAGLSARAQRKIALGASRG